MRAELSQLIELPSHVYRYGTSGNGMFLTGGELRTLRAAGAVRTDNFLFGRPCNLRAGSFGVHELRFAVVLPAVQVVVAAILLHSAGAPNPGRLLPHALLICHGLNAPALLSRIPGRFGPLSWVMGSIVMDFGMEDLLFLLGIIVTWYFVGRAMDRYRTPNGTKGSGRILTTLAHIFLLAVAGLMLVFGLHDFGDSSLYLFGRLERGVLALAWSAALFFVSVRALTRVIRSSVCGSV